MSDREPEGDHPSPERPRRRPGGRSERASDPMLRDPRLRLLAEESGYTVIERIGSGGMGIVYRAQDADGRDVAIKLLRPEIADDARARERLAREVSAQQRVRHENIVRIIDAELESPDAFVATQFVPGPTLEDAVRERGGLHPEAVREIGLVLGETLCDIHTAGIVHRDLKPSNILLRDAQPQDLDGFDPDGPGLDPVIIDFGIAQAAEESRLTSTGLVMGTAAYLDPEVVATNETSAASDWWAWAALLAFTATGREPFGSGRADVVFFRAQRGEIDLDGLPTEMRAFFRDALRAEPSARPDADELLSRLEELDLERYDDPGETEMLPAAGVAGRDGDAGSGDDRTSDGADADAGADRKADGGGPGATTPLGNGVTDPDAAPATEVLPAVGAREPWARPDATRPLPAGGDPEATDATEALPVVGAGAAGLGASSGHAPTEALPVGGWSTGGVGRSGGTSDPAPTEALHVGGWDDRAADATQQLPGHGGDGRAATGFHAAGADRGVGADPTEARRAPAPAEPRTEMLRPVGTRTRVMPAIRDDAPPPGGYGAPSPVAPPRQAPVATASGQGVAPAGYGYGPGGQPLGTGPYYAPVEPPAPRRTLLVWLGHLIIIGLGAVAPYVSLLAILLLGAFARTWERSHRSMERARRLGKTGGAAVSTGIAAPFRFVLALLETALMALLPLVLAVLLAVSADALAFYAFGRILEPAWLYGGAIAVTLLLTWVGLGGRLTRTGAHRLLDAAAPDRVWTLVVDGLLLLLLGAVAAAVVARGGFVDHFPFPTVRPEDYLPWRS
ncbi:serine/threonine-protein kinase [Brachybacterium huguangmaarense]